MSTPALVRTRAAELATISLLIFMSASYGNYFASEQVLSPTGMTRITLSAREGLIIPASCHDVRIRELVITSSEGPPQIQINPAVSSVVIERVEFARPGAALLITSLVDSNGVSLRELTIDDVVATQCIRSERSYLEFQAIDINTLSIASRSLGNTSIVDDNTVTAPDILMRDSARARRLSLSGMVCDSVNITIGGGKYLSLGLHNVAARSISVEQASGSTSEISCDTSMDVRLVGTKYDNRPMVKMRGVCITAGKMRISSANSPVVIMSNIRVPRNAQCDVTIDAPDAEFALDHSEVGGLFQVGGNGVRSVALSDIGKVDDYSAGDIACELPSVSSLALFNVRLNRLSICDGGHSLGHSEVAQLEKLRFCNVWIDDKLSLSVSAVRRFASARSSMIDRGRLFRVLQDIGSYCDNQRDIGLDAVYLKKKSDLDRVSRVGSVALDWVSGLGINHSKPLCVLFGQVALHALLRACLILVISRPRALAIVSCLWEAIAGAFGAIIGFDEPRQGATLGTRMLGSMRKLFQFSTQLQVTVWCIYLGTTALQ